MSFIHTIPKYKDNRGFLCKPYSESFLYFAGVDEKITESFYSVSNKNVLRGMHFQKEPYQHTKIINVVDGKIEDVIIDLRKGDTFGTVFSFVLDSKNSQILVIPEGFAHGFLTLSEKATVLYYTTSEHNIKVDSGIQWNSINYDWVIKNPIISKRDSNFITLKEYKDVLYGNN